jgi:hypothetical protein
LEEEKSGWFIEQQQQYEREKIALINQIETGLKKGPKLTWTVTNDIKKMRYQPKPNSNIGIKIVVCPDGKNKRINFLDLMIRLCLGDWLLQLNMSKRILVHNKQASLNKQGNWHIKISEIAPNKFWKVIGIMLVARIEGRKGEVWDRTEPEGYGQTVSVSEIMRENWFKQLRVYFAYLFAEPKSESTNPWWQFGNGINEYNNNCQRHLLARATKLLDELMSAFLPQNDTNQKSSKPAACTLRMGKYTSRKESEDSIHDNNHTIQNT